MRKKNYLSPYNSHFLSVESSPSLSPSNLSWVSLEFEVFMAFGPAKS